jgi:hypothetical protein
MAGVAYTNLQSGTYNCCQGYKVSGASIGLVEDAQLFTSAVSGNVNQIDVALGFGGGDNRATVSLWTDVGGAPGTDLSGLLPVSNQPVFGTTTTILTTVAVSGVSLIAGQQYFVVIMADNITLDGGNGMTQVPLASLIRIQVTAGSSFQANPLAAWTY